MGGRDRSRKKYRLNKYLSRNLSEDMDNELDSPIVVTQQSKHVKSVRSMLTLKRQVDSFNEPGSIYDEPFNKKLLEKTCRSMLNTEFANVKWAPDAQFSINTLYAKLLTIIKGLKGDKKRQYFKNLKGNVEAFLRAEFTS